jgi:hypothetical protein
MKVTKSPGLLVAIHEVRRCICGPSTYEWGVQLSCHQFLGQAKALSAAQVRGAKAMPVAGLRMSVLDGRDDLGSADKSSVEIY